MPKSFRDCVTTVVCLGDSRNNPSNRCSEPKLGQFSIPRGLPFVRYADDFVIFTKSQAAAQRVYRSVERFLSERLKLIVNHDKSSIRKTDGLEYVGYEFRGFSG